MAKEKPGEGRCNPVGRVRTVSGLIAVAPVTSAAPCRGRRRNYERPGDSCHTALGTGIRHAARKVRVIVGVQLRTAAKQLQVSSDGRAGEREIFPLTPLARPDAIVNIPDGLTPRGLNERASNQPDGQ
jgi:hypothetical protein